MDLAGQVAIDAPRERVWAALNDSVVLRACIPGCEELVDESAAVRRARVLLKMGPVRARFDGRLTIADMAAPERCALLFEASGGAAGTASGRSQVELHEDGAGTRVTYTVKAAVGGKLGQVGGRMIDASARQLADQFFAALRAHLAPVTAPAHAGPASVPPESVQDLVTAAPAASSAVTAPLAAQEAPRVLWFLLGAAATAFGVWLGKVLS
jgi:carbon monoxide dehydrogenase subunit G